MIINRANVELITYESPAVLKFVAEAYLNGRSGVIIKCDVLNNIAEDISHAQYNDFITYEGEALFKFICIERSEQELIAEIEEIISQYDLEDYF